MKKAGRESDFFAPNLGLNGKISVSDSLTTQNKLEL